MLVEDVGGTRVPVTKDYAKIVDYELGLNGMVQFCLEFQIPAAGFALSDLLVIQINYPKGFPDVPAALQLFSQKGTSYKSSLKPIKNPDFMLAQGPTHTEVWGCYRTIVSMTSEAIQAAYATNPYP